MSFTAVERYLWAEPGYTHVSGTAHSDRFHPGHMCSAQSIEDALGTVTSIQSDRDYDIYEILLDCQRV